MAQSGTTPIFLYGSVTPGAEPQASNLETSSTRGVEIAVNAADGVIYYKDTNGVVQRIGGGGGSQGPQGPQGETGPQGPQGETGPAGPKGADSTVAGPQGPQGETGPSGADSTVAGPAGPQGEAGPQGPKGADGAQGPAGAQGETGPAGPQGETGPAGGGANYAPWEITVDGGSLLFSVYGAKVARLDNDGTFRTRGNVIGFFDFEGV